MYSILSPSKTQDFQRNFPTGESYGHVSAYNVQTKLIVDALKKFSVADLQKTMRISQNIARVTHERFALWSDDYSIRQKDTKGIYNFSPAIYAFSGDVYNGFDLSQYTKRDFLYAQKHLGILSGLYGLLSAMTFMRPYRLEMGISMSWRIGGKEYKNLFAYWRDHITEDLQWRVAKNEPILNLASQEYSNVINRDNLDREMIDVDFKAVKNGVKRTIAIYAKRARGHMANWIITHRIDRREDLRKFSRDGWRYDATQSVKHKIVFVKKI